MMKIDDRSVVPLGWAISGLATMLTTTVIIAFWVSSVNFRLSRIEDKLGIPAFHTENTAWLKDAYADTEEKKPHAAHLKRLPVSVRDLRTHD